MTPTNFEKLRIYNLSESLADRIWETVKSWDQFAQDTLGKQMVRSADSIGANIAEGVGRRGWQDQTRFIYIARASINETKHWLRRAYTRKLLTNEQVESIKPILEELSPKLNAYLNWLKRRKSSEQPSTINHQPTKL